MTISQEQRSTYQSKVSEFTHQRDINTCLPVSLLNIIGELADSTGNDELSIDLDRAKDAVDYDPFMGSSTEFVGERLDPHLADFNYKTVLDRALDLDELDEIIQDPSCSYPIVELDSRYLDWVDAYEVQAGMSGTLQPHTVVPFGFNDESILLFDPMLEYHLDPERASSNGIEIPKPLFYEYWSGESVPRWTLWIEQQEQQTFDQIDTRGDE
ncbi:hypothetical protein R3751_16080 [Halorubrum distributum]|uniref:hypothetical protein n=1 Tax=Halorubrum distributum TaxID=29283 RepID=UPI002953847D|nr:hypothetical protein [Halorubrum distributum]MDV7351284.1 hypothetical protein [Halorubrum distributum]